MAAAHFSLDRIVWDADINLVGVYVDVRLCRGCKVISDDKRGGVSGDGAAKMPAPAPGRILIWHQVYGSTKQCRR